LLILAAIVPCICFYIIFSGVPMIYALYLSFHKWSFTTPPQWAGTANFVKVFTGDKIFYKALKNTLYYAVVTVPVGMVLALMVALMVNSVKRLTGVIRTIYFIPVVTSMVACAVVWRWLYQPRFGLFNTILSMMGLKKLMWLDSPSLAMPSVIAMSIWKGLGFTVVLFLAGLQGIPRTFYEAAEIDGASRLKVILYITIPLLRPTIAFILITGMIGSLQVFSQMYILTQGGPLYATTTIVYHLYLRAFEFFQMGYASSIAFVLFIMIITFTMFQLRMARTKWEY
jgi:multiple sugar transport system permease protein